MRGAGALAALLAAGSAAALAGAGAAVARADPGGAARAPAPSARRYRFEIAGEPVGLVLLSATPAPRGGVAVRYESRLRTPEPADEVVQRVISAEADADGRARSVEFTARDARGERRRVSAAGPVPSSLAYLLLAAARDGERRCLEVEDEESGSRGKACLRRRGAWLEGRVLGELVYLRAAPGELPELVELPGQGARFVADDTAALPAEAPRLFGTAVPLDGDVPARFPRAGERPRLSFCGREQDAEPGGRDPAAAVLARGSDAAPDAFPPGRSCRERTARYLGLLRDRGVPARHAVGVAWDGGAFVWHEWAEVQVGGRWLAVDPSFEQLPARGPRFTVGRFDAGDAAARAEAGRAVLACWGRGRIQAVP